MGPRVHGLTTPPFPKAAVFSMIMLSMLSTGCTTWYLLASQQPLDGGMPVRYSSLGHSLFFGLGLVLGLLQGAAMALLANRARNKAWWLTGAAIPAGLITGFIAMVAIGICFITIPRVLFDLLTE